MLKSLSIIGSVIGTSADDCQPITSRVSVVGGSADIATVIPLYLFDIIGTAADDWQSALPPTIVCTAADD